MANKAQLLEEALNYNISATEENTVAEIKELLKPVHNAIAEAKADAEAAAQEAIAEAKAEAKSAAKKDVYGKFKVGNKKYGVTVPKFRFKGEEYKAEDVAANNELAEALVEAKAFVVKAL